jgi:glycosyltransferase involved in cell wall biosynthesis
MRRAARLGIAERCRIRGHVADPSEVQAAYDAADIFCLPSRSEGLPRAMVEALAAGLPSVGSAAGGIPELLNSDQIVESPTGGALAECIVALLQEPDSYEQVSRAGLLTAESIRRSTRPDVLEEFLDQVLDQP